MLFTKGYLVLGCGCTDCFPDAIFFSPEDADSYGKQSLSCNPEGYRIKEIDIATLNITDE